MSDCLFCRIVAGEIPADVVYETDRTLAFRAAGAQSVRLGAEVLRTSTAGAAALAALGARTRWR